MPHILRVTPSGRPWPLYNAAASRQVEQAALASAPAQALMAGAGLAVARLVCAVAPHAQRVGILAGPGNNGGDGLVAARHLQAWGRQVQVHLLADPEHLPADARWAWQQARAAGVPVRPDLPATAQAQVWVDALLGLGTSRPAQGLIAHAIRTVNAQTAPVVAVDLPSGLSSDTGVAWGDLAVTAQHTLALLTLKPGLFTAHGRDHAGTVWLDRLAARVPPEWATASLGGPPSLPARRHEQHKGSFGDVLVLGGAAGMGGAAVLAARAALTAGAGRVYLCRLGPDALATDLLRPELMPRSPEEALTPAFLARSTVVCGCGGGDAVGPWLEVVLRHAARLVLDADALNALARTPALWPVLQSRHGPTLLTPHPLEAARLLGCTAADVQRDRLAMAQALAERSQTVVLLKGSGTVLAAPGLPVVINPSGNARLGTAGSGDVLAGWLGAWLAAWPLDERSAQAVLDCAAASAWLHGRAAEGGDPRLPLRAADLIDDMARTLTAPRP